MKKYLFIFILLFPSLSFSATHYVSPTGSDTWANSTDIAKPCAVSTAFANAAADDLIYFRGGTYSVPAKNSGDTYIGYYNPANSGTSGHPITFKAYPTETPLFDGTAGGSGDTPLLATIMGASQKSYIVFDGLSFQSDGGTKMARFMIGSNNDDNNGPYTTINITVQNCTFNGGNTITDTDNNEGIRVNKVNTVLIKGNTLHNYRETNEYHNTSAIKLYHTSNVTIENNDIHNATVGIYNKSNINTAIYRYNMIHDCPNMGIYTNAWASGYDMPSHSYYHNVFWNNDYASIFLYAEDSGTINNVSVYNNTVYNDSSSGDLYGILIAAAGNWTASNSQTVYNNIILGTAYKLTFAVGVIAECQYNQYGNAGSFNVRSNYGNGAITYSSLNDWHASTVVTGGVHPEGASTLNGLASDPLFVNSSENMNTLADFALQGESPCVGTGKAGVDMGANVALVGTGEAPAPDTTAPVVTAFVMPATASSTIQTITTFSCTDAVGVTGYIAQESSTPPLQGGQGWTTTAPATFTFASYGAVTLYGFCKDAAGNVSTLTSTHEVDTDTTTLTEPPPGLCFPAIIP